MLKQLLTRLLQHLITQNSWAKAELISFAGKSVRFNVFPVSAMLTVLEDGSLAMAGEALSADATITISPGVALRLMAGDETANTLIAIEGDTELATAMAKVMHEMSWDYEEDLSHFIGDAPAYQIGKFSRKVGAGVKRQSVNIAEMVAEYWQEEVPLLAKKRHVEQFIREVDTLREDTERLQKRFERLSALLDESLIEKSFDANAGDDPAAGTSTDANTKAP